ncbi:hypothetical protein A6770_17805 [Nostoc minutum NIES-26]|uniref:Uncharacterized protein n=1 Tax=Nostoc minutum NIES-26 TaxID=1844469 RepID=A0A367RAT0_9NOSO|nr:hypothetical protein A6770_17805 [Nostoc minutum NIES-26]
MAEGKRVLVKFTFRNIVLFICTVLLTTNSACDRTSYISRHANGIILVANSAFDAAAIILVDSSQRRDYAASSTGCIDFGL